MLDFIKQFPKQLQAGAQAASHITKADRNFTQATICGMGGSALPGDIIQELLEDQFPIRISREYSIPKTLTTKESIVFISSFSGNTEETISSLEQALTSEAHIIVMTHGGTLAEMAKTHNLPLIILPEAIQPRCATGLFIGAVLTALYHLGCIADMSSALSGAESFLESQKASLEEQAQELAKALHGTVPLIYSGKPLAPVARISKINFNETSKVQSFWNTIPEMNHNEMVGFTTLIMKPTMLFLRSPMDHPRVHLRMDVMAGIMKQKDIPCIFIDVQGSTHLEQMLYTLFLAYFASYYLALEYGVDPAPVDMVEDFKQLLVS